MTNEEKQELARQLKNSIKDLTSYLKIIPSPVDSDDIMWRIKVESLALAALTAQPVKLPRKHTCLGSNHIVNVMSQEINKMRNKCASAIRAAGYEVQE